MMSPRTALPMRFEPALLGLVRRKPIHGYNLLQYFTGTGGLGEIWNVKISQVYAYLNKLEEMGYLISERQQGGEYPARRLFSITPTGEAVFLDWMRSPVRSARDLRQLFLLKLFFSADVPQEMVRELLADQIALCKRWLEGLKREGADAMGWRLSVYQFRIEQVQASLAWLEANTMLRSVT